MFKEYNGANLRYCEISGTPEEMGRAHAEHLQEGILGRIRFFNQHSGLNDDIFETCDWYRKWREKQVEWHAREFPHMVEETEAIARYSGIPLNRLFDLTFSGWGIIKQQPPADAGSCSLVAVTTVDGTPALLSALDDAPEIWPAIAKYTSSSLRRYSFLTTVRPGTGGAGRGMNSAGLWIGTAGGGMGAKKGGPLETTRSFELTYLLRALLESCGTLDDVRHFCNQYRFSCNMLFGDKSGGILGLHQTLSGTYDVTRDGFAAMTNSVVDDRIIYELTRSGHVCNESVATSRPRHGFLMDFIDRYNRKCTFEAFVEHVARRDTVSAWSINHKGTAYITLAMPRKHPCAMWVCRPSDPENGEHFIKLDLES